LQSTIHHGFIRIVDDLHLNKKHTAVGRISDRTDCQWPWKSSKVDDFYLIWKGVCDFLLVINNNLGPTSLRDMACYSLKLPTENWSRTAAAGNMITIDSI